MATNPEAVELAKKNKVEYEWGTLWPHYHKEKMNWGGGFKTKGDVDILFLSGETGRDPFEIPRAELPRRSAPARAKSCRWTSSSRPASAWNTSRISWR